MKQKVIIAIIAMLVIVAAVFVYTHKRNNQVTNITETNQNNEPQEGDIVGDIPGDPKEDPLTPTSDTIAVSTQVPGNSVTIDNVYLSKPGFIDIHESTSNGQPGKSVGVSGYLGVGAKQDLEITATLAPGGKYFAVVHVDNGDKKYTYPTDAAAMSNGLPVQTMFSVSQ